MSLLTSVFIATSLDGFIARKNGDLDWLDAANATVPIGEDCGYSAFMKTIDILVMGRKTYEQVLSFGKWPYEDKNVIVLSSNTIEIPQILSQTVSYSSESPKELYDRLFSENIRRIYIDGGNTIQRFLAEGLIDEITITVIPVILGSGIPLFRNVKNDISLKLVSTKSFDFGFVQLSYEVINND
ncbi:MAG: dihydrofolate reductase [Candidatus Marinimicrobia bacterium]|nr:dihydrofolate reductase [Candidatus Neomarinimicrobiota bacterium]